MEADDLAFLEARWRLYDWSPNDLREVADDLRSQGVSESQALIDLVFLRPDEFSRKGPELFEQMLVELGGGDMTRDRAAAVAAKRIARDVLDGSITPAQAANAAGYLNSASGYEDTDLFAGLSLAWDDDELTYLERSGGTVNGHTYDDLAAEVLAAARRLLAEYDLG